MAKRNEKNTAFLLHGSVYFRMLVLTVLVVIVFYSIGLYLNARAADYVIKDLIGASEARCEYMASELTREIMNLAGLEQDFIGNTSLSRLAITNQTMSAYQHIEAIRALSNQLLSLKRFSSLVAAAKIHLPQSNVTISSTTPIYDTITDDEYNAIIDQSSRNRPNAVLWDNNLYITLAYPNLTDRDVLFCAALQISPENMASKLRNMLSETQEYLAIITNDNRMFSYYGGTNLWSDAMEQMEREPERTRIEIEKSNYILISRDITQLNMRLLYLTPEDPSLNLLRLHWFWTWGLTLFAALLLVIYFSYFNKAVYKPLNEIYRAISNFKLDKPFRIRRHSNEFETIYQQFEDMVDHINILAREVYEEKYRAQQAELMQLQVQIRPHFLHNTLYLIYRMAKKEGNEDIANLSGNLSRYYEYITHAPGDEAELAREIKHIETYLQIQLIRFSRRITVKQMPLPAELTGEMVPPLILQPLVENVFEHGLKNTISDGMIIIDYLVEDDYFEVTIKDNGGMIDDGMLKNLRETLERGTIHDSSALVNVHRRLKLRYGAGCGLRLSSEDCGLVVTARFVRTKPVNNEER